uniref:Protein kinase cGMP-dependent 3 n=1 Tax=Scleropages formosus TaxID=113540 RepID=A0A8C9SDE2_SCLFO
MFIIDCQRERSSNDGEPDVRKSRTAVIVTDESSLIIKAIQKNDFLSRLDDEQVTMMVDCLVKQEISQGEAIIVEGTEGNSMYIVAEGELLVTQAGRVLRTLTSGDVFGELAILYNCKRTASVKAVTNVKLWCIERQTYRTIVTNKSKKKREQIMGFLKTGFLITFIGLVLVIINDVPENLSCVCNLSSVLIYLSSLSFLGMFSFYDSPLRPLPCPRSEYLFFQVTCQQQGKYYALKRISKKHIVAKRQEEHVKFEKRILQEIQSDFIVRLHAGFRDTRYIYMVMEFCSGGELWTKLKESGRFEESIAVFCAACVVEAYAYLHKRGILYRDLKPENLMLDKRGYVKLVDFGFAKELLRGEKTYSFCGTPEYMAPEIIQNHGHDFASDFWSLGVLVFEFLVGSPPFASSDPQKIYAKILDGALKFPPYMGEAARSLISKLCRPRPGQRLGNTKNGIKDLKSHSCICGFSHLLLQGPCYINFDRHPYDRTQAEEDLSGWDDDF